MFVRRGFVVNAVDLLRRAYFALMTLRYAPLLNAHRMMRAAGRRPSLRSVTIGLSLRRDILRVMLYRTITS
jgi:hypothetical protein